MRYRYVVQVCCSFKQSIEITYINKQRFMTIFGHRSLDSTICDQEEMEKERQRKEDEKRSEEQRKNANVLRKKSGEERRKKIDDCKFVVRFNSCF